MCKQNEKPTTKNTTELVDQSCLVDTHGYVILGSSYTGFMWMNGTISRESIAIVASELPNGRPRKAELTTQALRSSRYPRQVPPGCVIQEPKPK